MRKAFFYIVLLFLLGFWVKPHAQPAATDSSLINITIKRNYEYAFNHPDSGLLIANGLIAEARRINYPFGVAYAKIFSSDCYISKGDYAKAIQSLLEARTLCMEENITALDQRINRPFGRIYIELGNPEKAIQHQRLALEQSMEPEETAIVTHSLAEAYFVAGKLDSALIYAKDLYDRAGTLWAALPVLLGDVYSAMGRNEEALDVYRTKSGLTFQFDIVANYTGRAKAFLNLGQPDSCRFYAEKALKLAQDHHFFKFINRASALLASSYQAVDREKYLHYLNIQYAAKDSLYSRKKLNQFNSFIFADETRKRDLAAAELKFATQKRQFLLVAISLLLLTAGLFLWRNNRVKTKSNALLLQEKHKAEQALEQLKSTQSQLMQAEKTARQLEMQEAERLRDLDNLKTRLYTNITHEFRTPLTVIMGMSDNISGHKQERTLIRRNAKNLLRLINQLLDLSKLDSGTLKLDTVQGDIISYLQYLTESFYSMASDKKVSLGFRAEPPSLIMDFDEVKIQHVIYNLLSNAIKFTRPGGKIALEAGIISGHGKEFLTIKVKDTGSGILAKDIPHIFDRFYQVENAGSVDLARTFSGTGIGLALTKELIELMGGSIAVKSQVNWGTEFTVSLPVRQHDATPKMAAVHEIRQSGISSEPDFRSLPAKPDQLPGDKPQVLVVEDNAGVVTYIQSLLEQDYYVQVAINGQEGIDMALENVPDLIVTDVMMPEKNGYEVCATLKNDERTSHIPIVMLTAKADVSSKIEGLEMGADAYLSKPFEKEELLVRLRKLLELRRTLQEYYSSFDESGHSPSSTSKPTIEDIFLQKLRAAVENRLGDTGLSIPELSREMIMSHTQLYRKLKALTGKTPSQFIRTLRLKKAMQLLKTSESNISEIAYEVGFSDPNYFSRMFKQEFGKVPGEVR